MSGAEKFLNWGYRWQHSLHVSILGRR